VIDKDDADYGGIKIIIYNFFIANYFYRFTNIIPRIARALEDADMVFTHSNGAHFCMKALKLIKNHKIKIVHYSPALNAKWKFNERFCSCFVFHTDFDKTVNFARWIPFSSWGNMGNVGSKAHDMRVYNIDSSNYIKSHSAWFYRWNISKVFKETIQNLKYR